MEGVVRFVGSCATVVSVGCCALVFACATGTTEPEINQVDPDYVLVGQAELVTLSGANLFTAATIDLETGAAQVDQRLTVRIGDRTLAPADVNWISATQIDIRLPGDLAIGDYDVEVVLPSSATAELPDGLHIVTEILGVDAGVGGPDASDGDGGVPGCTGLYCYSVPTEESVLSSPASDDGVSLTGDQLEIYIHSSRIGNVGKTDIWVSTRASTADPWGPMSNIAELNTGDHERVPSVSFDGLRLYFQSDRTPATTDEDTFISTRALRSDPWGTPVRVTELSGPDQDKRVVETADGLALVRWVSLQAFQVHTRAVIGDAWALADTLSELGAPIQQVHPMLANGGLAIFYSSNQAGGAGGTDIYMADRASLSDDFGNITNLTSLNGPGNDQGVWISDDMSTIYFASDTGGTRNIFSSSLLP